MAYFPGDLQNTPPACRHPKHHRAQLNAPGTPTQADFSCPMPMASFPFPLLTSLAGCQVFAQPGSLPGHSLAGLSQKPPIHLLGSNLLSLQLIFCPRSMHQSHQGEVSKKQACLNASSPVPGRSSGVSPAYAKWMKSRKFSQLVQKSPSESLQRLPVLFIYNPRLGFCSQNCFKFSFSKCICLNFTFVLTTLTQDTRKPGSSNVFR
jgi:hypothetical protein